MNKWFSKIVLKLCGWTATEYPNIDKCVIGIAPHTSMWDFLWGKLFLGIHGVKAKILIKKEMFFFPLGPILKMMGSENLLLPSVTAKLQVPLKNKPGRVHFVRGILRRQGPDLVVASTGTQGSGILSSMTAGNCFIVMPEGKTAIAVDEPVECEIFDMHLLK